MISIVVLLVFTHLVSVTIGWLLASYITRKSAYLVNESKFFHK